MVAPLLLRPLLPRRVTLPNVTISPIVTLTCTTPNETLTANSTTGGVTFDWGGGNIGPNYLISTPGNYTVTVTDPTNNCTASATTLVIQDIAAPDAGVNPPATLSCTNANVTLTATSTTAGATFDWGGGNIGSTYTITIAGTYNVTVTDPNNGCTATAFGTVTQNITVPNLTVNPPSTLTCAITSVTITANSTTAGATFDWGGGNVGATYTVTLPNTYNVTVTDPNNGCTATAPAVVAQNITAPDAGINPAGTLTCTVTTVTLTATSTTAGATFDWGGGNVGANYTVSLPNTYNVTVTDPSNGCTSTIGTTVLQNTTPPNSGINPPLTLTCTTTSVTLTATSTTAGATFDWGGGNIGATYVVTQPGPYGVTVTDPSNQCTSNASVNVIQNITAPDAGIVSPVTLTCTAVNITLTATSTTAGATFDWGGGNIGATYSVSAPGPYTVTVTDPNNGCTATASTNVPQNITPPNVGINPPDTLTCANTTVTLTATSTTPNAGFDWGASHSPNFNVTGPGPYSVTVTDETNGCTSSASVDVIQSAPLNFTETQAEVNCFGMATGSITLTITAGTAPFTFNWTNGSNSQNLINLVAGSYSVTATDNNTCSLTGTYVITQPQALTVNDVSSNVSCNGGNNGTINVTPGGGTTPYTFLWNNQSNTQNATGLTAGTYTMTVTDANQCTVALSSVVITQPTALNLTGITTDASCWGYTNGTITTTISGGTPGYVPAWSNGSSQQSLGNLAAGTYTVTFTDANSCNITGSYVINEPLQIIAGGATVDPSCKTNPADGIITLAVNGGNGPYTYLWSTNSSASNLHELAPGNYSVTVTDATGCTVTDAFTLAYIYDFSIQATPGVTIKLGGSTLLGYTVSGNAGTYVTAWTPSEGLNCSDCVSPTASPTLTTLYDVEITNTLGCKASDTLTVVVNPDYTVYVPNAFTPNGDGLDDYFQIYGNLEAIEYIDVQVFDRWGEKVFEGNNPEFKWDGTYKGTLQNSSVYVWQMKITWLNGHRDEMRSGSITLLR